MASKDGDGGGNELDVMALLHEVHGTADGARGAAVDAALRTLEVTHRKASLAMRAFEQDGMPNAGRMHGQSAPAPQRVVRAAAPADAAREAPAQARHAAPETTAVWRPDDAPAATPVGLPRAASAEATAVGPAPRDASDAGPRALTRDDAAQHPAASPARADGHVDVYAGRGASWAPREVTKTQRIVRPKK